MDFLSARSMPWLEPARRQLAASFEAQRVPHSLLLLSSPGLGAERLADWLAALVTCESSGEKPCGRCASCVLLLADTHPDVTVVRVEEGAQQIKVDQIRGLIESLGLKSYRSGFKVGIIEGAELLNANGANAFLKTLEEPTANTVLILIAARSHRLPATIASRCLRITLTPPPADAAIAWLSERASAQARAPAAKGRRGANESTQRAAGETGQRAANGSAPRGEGGGARSSWAAALSLAGGAPLLAAELADIGIAELDADMQDALRQLAAGSVDVTLLAERWARTNPALRITWLENWITRRVQAALAARNSQESAEPVRLPAALLKAKIQPLFEWLDALREYRRLGSTGVNQQLALEALLLGGRAALAK